MKDFSWKYFALTGDVESYLLYKDIYNQDVSLQSEPIVTMENDENIMSDEGTIN